MHIQDIEAFLNDLKNQAITDLDVDLQVAQDIALADPPNPEMGDRGFPCFALAPVLKRSPQQIAEQVAEVIEERLDDDSIVQSINLAGPYVNFELHRGRLAAIVLSQIEAQGSSFGQGRATEECWVVEFSAPNTNKPQHLGHVRNNLLGDSVCRILDHFGHHVAPVNLINDRGIHICKSMVAYQNFADGETPQSTGEKGDHFVGRYYVRFNQAFQTEYEAWQATDDADERFQEWLDQPDSKPHREGVDDPQDLRDIFFDHYEHQYFNGPSELGAQARQMLQDWEDGDDEVRALWSTMNGWVLQGFKTTYANLGIEFDRLYLESETYQRGREIVEQGLDDGLFFHRDDGAVACDLEPFGLDGDKVLLRSDGTTVYMTQDLGTAEARFQDYQPDQMVYVVGDEQAYHFQVLFSILGELYPQLKGQLHHLSYGMVELPDGKMKSREGKVVDADDLLAAMVDLAAEAVDERYDGLDEDERRHRAETIALAALKFYILDFAPRTTVHFDPSRSIDFQGRTGPYCLYSVARINSLERRLGGWPDLDGPAAQEAMTALGSDLEMQIIHQLKAWPSTVASAADQLHPGRVAEYLFELANAFSSLYNDDDHRIVDLQGPRRDGLLLLARAVQTTLITGLDLLGIPTLDEM